VLRAARSVGWFAVLQLVIGTSLFLTKSDPLPQLIVVAGVIVAIFAMRSPTLCLYCILAAYTIPLLNLTTPSFGSMDTRIVALPFVAVVGVRAVHVWRSGSSGLRRPALTASNLALPCMAVLGLASTTWSIDPIRTVGSALVLAAVAVLCLAVSCVLSLDQLLTTVYRFALVAVAGSILLLIILPDMSIEAGRVRGVFVNANTLAVFLVVTFPAAVTRAGRLKWPVTLAWITLCASTASRAGSAALIVELSIFLMIRYSARTRAAILLGGLAAGGWLALAAMAEQLEAKSTLLLLRTNNSRAADWAKGFDIFERHPYVGVGFGALQSDPAGLVPQLLASTGIVGFIIATGFVVAVALRVRSSNVLYAALVVGAVVNVVFEPWLFAGGSLYCLIFWLIVTHPDSVHALPERLGLRAGEDRRPFPGWRRRVVAEVAAPCRSPRDPLHPTR
jgi:hypothetical protein